MVDKIKDIFKLPFFILLIVIGLILMSLQELFNWLFEKYNINIWKDR